MSTQKVLEFDNNELVPLLFGEHNAHLRHLEKRLDINISNRGNVVTLSGEDRAVSIAQDVLDSLWRKLVKKHEIGVAEVDAVLRFLGESGEEGKNPASDTGAKGENGKAPSELAIQTRRKTIAPRSPNQAAYLEAIRAHDMVFGIGPAGTGKTYLAVAAGVSMYLKGEVERLVFCRPAVEAGERLGFLPGDMKEKVDPYLRPIYDALHDMLPWEVMLKKMETGDIEVAPLAFMRGRTLANAFVILDEAQNATAGQMKMFLTRMGESSRMVVNGDPTQTDLPRGVLSGLAEASALLGHIEEIKFVRFDKNDVIRHRLVGKIIHAYDQKTGD